MGGTMSNSQVIARVKQNNVCQRLGLLQSNIYSFGVNIWIWNQKELHLNSICVIYVPSKESKL